MRILLNIDRLELRGMQYYLSRLWQYTKEGNFYLFIGGATEIVKDEKSASSLLDILELQKEN